MFLEMKRDLEIYWEYGKKLERYLRPSTFPIAIKLINEGYSVAPGAGVTAASQALKTS